MKEYGYFFVPLYFEFKRENCSNGDTAYLSPCGILITKFLIMQFLNSKSLKFFFIPYTGVELNSLEDVYKYLKITESKLNVNQFVFTGRCEVHRDHDFFRVFRLFKLSSK